MIKKIKEGLRNFWKYEILRHKRPEKDWCDGVSDFLKDPKQPWNQKEFIKQNKERNKSV